MSDIMEFMMNDNEGYTPTDSFIDTDKELKTKMVSIYDIAFNPLNDQGDTPEELEEFADVIYEEGLVRSPLNVYKKLQEDGKKYVLLGGDRRLHALLLNAKKYSDSQKMISIVIEPAPKDEVEEELKILELNEHRALTPEREKKLVKRYLRIFRSLEGRGEKPKGQVRKWIAARMNIGEKKTEKYIHEIEGYKRTIKKPTIPEDSVEPEVCIHKIDDQREIDKPIISDIPVDPKKDSLSKISEALKYELNRSVSISKDLKLSIQCESKEDIFELLCLLGFDDIVEYAKE